MAEQVQYLTNERGERVGVVVSLETYDRLRQSLVLDAECLIGMSRDELQALANSQLALADQTRLDNLIARNAEAQLADVEIAELDALLAQADQLTILKTRARYTLKQLEFTANAS